MYKNKRWDYKMPLFCFMKKYCIFLQKPLDKSDIIKYNNKALAGVAESADAHV